MLPGRQAPPHINTPLCQCMTCYCVFLENCCCRWGYAVAYSYLLCTLGPYTVFTMCLLLTTTFQPLAVKDYVAQYHLVAAVCNTTPTPHYTFNPPTSCTGEPKQKTIICASAGCTQYFSGWKRLPWPGAAMYQNILELSGFRIWGESVYLKGRHIC